MQFQTIILSLIALTTSTIAVPVPDAISCWSTCSLSCVQSGLLQGGLCDASGTCTCLTGIQTREASPAPIAEASPSLLSCYSTCSVGCVRAGFLQGGLCNAAGTCSCLTGIQTREAEAKAAPVASPDLISCYTDCSVGCINAGNLRGGLCSADGTCSCL